MPNNMLYTQLDNGIHRVIWLKDMNRKTIDAYIELFVGIMNDSSENSMLLILHDYRNVPTPSFNAMANAMKPLVVREDMVLRIAHLYSDNTYPMIVKNASLVARFNANRKFFNMDEEQVALEWLLEEPSKEE